MSSKKLNSSCVIKQSHLHYLVKTKNHLALEKCFQHYVYPVKDEAGYTPFYYAVIQQDDVALNLFRRHQLQKWGKQDLLNAVVHHDMKGLQLLIKEGVKVDVCNEKGQSALDLALLHHNDEAIKLLRKFGATYVSKPWVAPENPAIKLNNEKPEAQFKINIHGMQTSAVIELTQSDSHGVVNRLRFNPWESEECPTGSDWKIFRQKESCFIYIPDKENATKPAALYEVARDGNLTVHFVNQATEAMSIHSNRDCTFKSLARVKHLQVKAAQFSTLKESQLVCGEALSLSVENAHVEGGISAKTSYLRVEDSLLQEGKWDTEMLDISANTIKQHGKIVVTKDYTVEAKGDFHHQGEWISEGSGKIQAHQVSLHEKSLLISKKGEINLYAKSKLDNDGVVIAKYINLGAGLIINHNYGAMLKGLTCLMNAPQVNSSGYVLRGQNESLNALHWLLNIAHAGVNIAQLTSYAPLPLTYKLRTAIVVSKSVVRAGELLYKLSTGRGHEISQSEMVSFLLDNVVPSFGAITSQKEKAQLLVNILYHIYGAFLSEEEVLQRSLTMIEAISRFVEICTDNAWLKDAAKIIKYTRYACKVAEISGQAYSLWQGADPKTNQQSMQNIKALAEVAFREFLYALPPVDFLKSNLNIDPKDIALFIMNKGHHSETLLRSILYGALHLAKKQGLFEKGGYAEIELCLQIYLKSKSWQNLYYAYQNKELSMNTLVQEALHGLISVLNYQALKNQQKPEVTQNKEEAKSEVVTEMEPEETPVTEAVKEVSPSLIDEAKEAGPSPAFDANRKYTPEEIEEIKNKDLEAHACHVPEYEKKVLTQDVSAMIEEHFANQNESPKDINLLKATCDSLLEITRALNGDYAANGHFVAFADAFHNEGVIDNPDDMSIYARHSGTNNNALRSGRSIGIYGNDIAKTFFQNLESGSMTAQEAVYFSCLRIIENKGQIFSQGKIKVHATKIVKNYQQGQIIAKEDVELLAEALSENAGLISGKNVDFGGKEKVRNTGIVFAENNLKLMSQKLVELTKEGLFVAKRVQLETPELIKDGSIQATLVRTLGNEQSSPDKIIWHKGDKDAIAGLVMKTDDLLELEKDALNSVIWTDLTLPDSSLQTKESLLDLDPTFANSLQIHLPNLKGELPLEKLPNLATDGTFIVEAPLATLKVGEQSTYANTLRFIGDQFDYSNHSATFEKPLLLDVKDILAESGSATLKLKEGGFLQADLFKNRGYLYSDDILTLNLKALEDAVQLENYTQQFKYSSQLPSLQTCHSTKVIENSGKIYALGLQGYIGDLNLVGGQLLSGKEGNHVYFKSANVEAALTWQGVNTTEILHDGGQNWHAKPVWVNAQIGSEGKNILIGEKFTAKGGDLWGDEGGYLNVEEKDIRLGVKSQGYEIAQVESWDRRGKVDKVIQPYTMTAAVTKNNIDSDNQQFILVAQKGNIHLQNTSLSASSGIHLLAKGKVSIEGILNKQLETIHYNSSRLFRESSFHSVTTDNKVYASYLFTGGDLVVRASHFELSAVNGIIGGDADIVAAKTTLQGKTQTHDNTTVAYDFKMEAEGINNISHLFNGHNAKAIFSSFMSACGWNQAELENLLQTKNLTELPAPLLHAARNAWNMTAFVAHACNEYGTSPEEFVGAFTDKIGLTSTFETNGIVSRFFNPEFSFNFKKTNGETHTSQVIPTTLYVGGTFRLIGEELQLLGGAQVDANQLSIFLTQGIKAVKGVDTTQHIEKIKKVDFSVNVTDLTDFKVGVTRESTIDESVHCSLNKLHARDVANIACGDHILGDLKITSVNGGAVSAPRIQLSSVQNQESHRHSSKGLTGGKTSLNAHYQQDSSLKTTTEKAGIWLPHGKVITDSLVLNKGAKIQVSQLSRLDGQEGLPQVSGSESIDRESETHQDLSVHLSKLENQADIEKKYRDKVTLHRPTIIADNVQGKVLPGINTLAEKESEVIRDKEGGYTFAAFKPDIAKIAQEAKEIKKAAQEGLHWLQKPKLPEKKTPSSPAAPKELLPLPPLKESEDLEWFPPLPQLEEEREKEKKKEKKKEGKTTEVAEKPSVVEDQNLFDEFFADHLQHYKEARLSPDCDDYLKHLDLSAGLVPSQSQKKTSALYRIVQGVQQQREAVNAGFAAVKNIHPVLDIVVPGSMEGVAVEAALLFSGSKGAVTGMQWAFKEYKVMQAANQAQKGGKYAGEFLQMQKREINQLKKSANSHAKQVQLHQEKIKNPRATIKDWDKKSQKERQGLITKWKADAYRNSVYERLAKRLSKERGKPKKNKPK